MGELVGRYHDALTRYIHLKVRDRHLADEVLQEFWTKLLTGKLAALQLTSTKLERLMDRYAGREWLPSKLKHLDLPESERSDVLRGLKTYVAAGPENAKTFADLYSQLPSAKKVLEPGVVKDLEGTKGSP